MDNHFWKINLSTLESFLFAYYLFIIGEFDVFSFLCSVFMIMIIILDCKWLQKFHGCLAANFRNSVEEKDFFFCIFGVIQIHRVELKAKTIYLQLFLKRFRKHFFIQVGSNRILDKLTLIWIFPLSNEKHWLKTHF